jgi:hypothetical protein
LFQLEVWWFVNPVETMSELPLNIRLPISGYQTSFPYRCFTYARIFFLAWDVDGVCVAVVSAAVVVAE